MTRFVLQRDLFPQPTVPNSSPPLQSRNRYESFGVMFDRLARLALPGKEYLERYLRQLVCRNLRRLTIEQTFRTLRAFLLFLHDAGSPLDQLKRPDIEFHRIGPGAETLTRLYK